MIDVTLIHCSKRAKVLKRLKDKIILSSIKNKSMKRIWEQNVQYWEHFKHVLYCFWGLVLCSEMQSVLRTFQICSVHFGALCSVFRNAACIGNISNMFYGRKKLIRGSRLRCRGRGDWLIALLGPCLKRWNTESFETWNPQISAKQIHPVEDWLITFLGLLKGRMIAWAFHHMDS